MTTIDWSNIEALNAAYTEKLQLTEPESEMLYQILYKLNMIPDKDNQFKNFIYDIEVIINNTKEDSIRLIEEYNREQFSNHKNIEIGIKAITDLLNFCLTEETLSDGPRKYNGSLVSYLTSNLNIMIISESKNNRDLSIYPNAERLEKTQESIYNFLVNNHNSVIMILGLNLIAIINLNDEYTLEFYKINSLEDKELLYSNSSNLLSELFKNYSENLFYNELINCYDNNVDIEILEIQKQR